MTDRERIWRTGTRVSLLVLAGLLLLLVGTGTWLAFRYQPKLSAYSALDANENDVANVMQDVHAFAGYLAILALVALAVFGTGLLIVRHRPGWAGVPIVAFVLGLGALFTGVLLPWDQVALLEAAEGEIRGYWAIVRGENIAFVLLGTDEISTPTLSRFFWMHTIVIPVLLIAAMAVIPRVRRRDDDLPDEIFVEAPPF